MAILNFKKSDNKSNKSFVEKDENNFSDDLKPISDFPEEFYELQSTLKKSQEEKKN